MPKSYTLAPVHGIRFDWGLLHYYEPIASRC
jgi:hypothetical protein